MPNPGPVGAAVAWTIRSVAVRRRDGPDRLDQAYRRLLDGPPSADTAPAPPIDRPFEGGSYWDPG
jgi:hypothetical protein